VSQNFALAGVPTSVVSSTIKAASLLAAGQAAGVVTAKVAALTEGVVQAMFTTKIKSVLAVVLVVGLVLGGVGAGVGLSTHPAALAQHPGAKADDAKKNDDKATLAGLPPKQDGKAGKEKQKVLTPEEAIKQMPKENVTVQFKVASVEVDLSYLYSGFDGGVYVYLKDGGKFTAALICKKYAIHGDQLKKLGIERDEDFKGKIVRVTGRVEFLNMKGASPKGMFVRSVAHIEVVQPKTDGKEQKPNEEKQPVPKELSAEQPKAKGGPPDAKKVLTPDEAIKLMPKENVTVQFKVASVARPNLNYRGYYLGNYIQLRDGGKFVANLFGNALAIERSGDLTGKMVRVTGRVEPAGGTLFRMVVRDANNVEVVKE